MIDFIRTNHLTSTDQSDFKPGNPCINQLLSITHAVFLSFDKGNKFEVYFLTYQRYLIWFVHKGLIFKLEQNGISGKLLRLMKRFLK